MPFFRRRAAAPPTRAPAPAPAAATRVANPAAAAMRALAEKKASTPTPSGSAAKIPAMLQMGKADPTPAAQPNLSTAIGQLKSGDRLGADATMRKIVGMKKGGKVSSSPKSSKVPSASKRADGIAQKGKTKGRMI